MPTTLRRFFDRLAVLLLGVGLAVLCCERACGELVAAGEARSQAQAAEAGEQEAVDASPLDDLAWVVGDWTDTESSDRLRIECRWTANRSFITRRFSVVDADQNLLLEGTQVIGWDPAAQGIRSWTFDSEGGFGEAVWSQDGDRWLIKATFTLFTGERASALNILTRLDENTATWSSVNREIAGEIQPSQPEVTVARVVPDQTAPKDLPE